MSFDKLVVNVVTLVYCQQRRCANSFETGWIYHSIILCRLLF
uniref:Uncharacterized protein n=1 Tax=Arundo donax TaxID=35708 RepID=A0A0A9FF18_ARUDO